MRLAVTLQVREIVGSESRELTRYMAKMEERSRHEEELFNRAPLTKAEKTKEKHLKKSRNGCALFEIKIASSSILSFVSRIETDLYLAALNPCTTGCLVWQTVSMMRLKPWQLMLKMMTRRQALVVVAVEPEDLRSAR